MRLCHRAGYAVPLLTISAILAGCATSTTDQPPNFNSSPQVVAVYAIDSAFGTMPDVLIYSTAAGDTGKISTNPPPSYGSYRVEFDQPINGTSVANNADRGTGPTPGGAASFCSPLSTNPFQLVDVDGGNRVVVSSVCYDATSPLGEHPHVLVVPGRNALNDPTAKPLTCNTFRADPGLRDDGNVFANDKELVGRFLGEARALKAISHRAMVHILSIGELGDGTHYMVMEFLEGKSFEEVIKHGAPLPLRDDVDVPRRERQPRPQHVPGAGGQQSVPGRLQRARPAELQHLRRGCLRQGRAHPRGGRFESRLRHPHRIHRWTDRRPARRGGLPG